MAPDELVEGEQYVVSFDVQKNGEEHPQLDPGDLVTLVNASPDADGEVYVVATALADGASIGAWVRTDYLITQEQAERWVQENSDIAQLTSPAPPTGKGSDTDSDSSGIIGEFSYIPHPEYPNLPTYETLPLGYALGVVAFIRGMGAKPADSQTELIRQYLQGRGFPIA